MVEVLVRFLTSARGCQRLGRQGIPHLRLWLNAHCARLSCPILFHDCDSSFDLSDSHLSIPIEASIANFIGELELVRKWLKLIIQISEFAGCSDLVTAVCLWQCFYQEIKLIKTGLLSEEKWKVVLVLRGSQCHWIFPIIEVGIPTCRYLLAQYICSFIHVGVPWIWKASQSETL